MIVDPNSDHNYRGIKDIQKIISMLEEMVINPEYDASIGVGPGDYAFGDIRIPSEHVRGFVDLLRSLSPEHDVSIRNITLNEMIKLSMMIEENETDLWEQVGRSKNDGYINGSHSGYGRALRDMRQWIDRIKMANGGLKI